MSRFLLAANQLLAPAAARAELVVLKLFTCRNDKLDHVSPVQRQESSMREHTKPAGAARAIGVAVASLIAAAIPGAASAAIITFTGEDLGVSGGSFPNASAARDQFVASLNGSARGIVETFEHFPLGGLSGPPQTLALTATGATGPITGQVRTTFFQNQVSNAGGGGRFATSGSQYFAATQPFSLAFDQPISAIGFFLTGLGDVGFDRLSLTLSGDATATLAVPYTLDNAQDGAERAVFYGLTSTQSFNTATFAFPGLAVDAYGLDDLIVADSGQIASPATPVPEPPMSWLFGTLAAALIAFRIRNTAQLNVSP